MRAALRGGAALALAAAAALAASALAPRAAAQSMPPASRIQMAFLSPKSLARLDFDWDAAPDPTPVVLPDGGTEPATAPWPFVAVVSSEESRAASKIEANCFGDARVAIATKAVKLVKLSPAEAVALPYLESVPKILDPTLVVLDRRFRVVGVLRQKGDFTAEKLLALMSKAAAEAYEMPLAAFVAGYFDLLGEWEKLWKEERALEDMATRAGERSGGRAKEFEEIDRREAALASADASVLDREEALRARMAPRSAAGAAPLPDRTGGPGKGGRALTPEEKEAIAAWRGFARNPNPVVRAAALEDLGAIDSSAMVDEILRGANDTDPRVVRSAGRALARMKSAESVAAMTAALRAGGERAAVAALFGFADASAPALPPEVLPLLVERATKGNDDARRAALEAIAKKGDASAVPALVAALADPVEAIRVLAAAALGRLRSKEAVPALVAALAAADWSLRKAAAEALGRIRSKESIEPLIARFEAEEGLLLEVCHAALVAIVGRDFGFEPADWRAFWTRSGEGFRVPTDEEVAEAKQRAERGLEGYAKPGKHVYHKIETLSRKMIFVIDVSASMDDKIVIPPDAPRAVHDEFPNRVKMEIARKELIDILASLEDYVQFNIVTFAGRVDSWKPSLVPASNKNAAIKWVSQLQPMRASGRGMGSDEQKTNTYGALLAAFGLADEKVTDWKRRSKVDTIFFVTDGTPTAGEIIEPPKIIDAITELNASRGIVIHVICFDKMAGERLRPLAERNGGRYVLRGH